MAQPVRVPVAKPGPLAQPGEGAREVPGSIGVPGQPLAAEHWDQMEAHGVHVIVFGGLCDEDLGHGITHSG